MDHQGQLGITRDYDHYGLLWITRNYYGLPRITRDYQGSLGIARDDNGLRRILGWIWEPRDVYVERLHLEDYQESTP